MPNARTSSSRRSGAQPSSPVSSEIVVDFMSPSLRRHGREKLVEALVVVQRLEVRVVLRVLGELRPLLERLAQVLERRLGLSEPRVGAGEVVVDDPVAVELLERTEH